ncbi:lysophospholipid acyltransferase family protein [Chitinibacteraceae bacterium HSL-7]
MTPIFATIAILVLPLPPVLRYRIVTMWSRLMLGWLHITCGLKCVVEGRENIPQGPAMIMCKHQSAWETMAVQTIFPPMVFVLKRELLKLPFFGWGLRTLSPIAIDRANRSEAQRLLMDQGRDRLAKGFWITIFPEGTRVAPGAQGKYRLGGARLAQDLGIPVVPVALNAGEFWPRNSFCKWPGTITVRVGPAVAPDVGSPAQMMASIEGWIETQMGEISGRGPHGPKV